jgi:hypothetical protein
MKLSNFNVVHARPEAAVILDDPPVHCFAGDQIVLAYVARQALMDHFKVPDERCVATAACPRASEAGPRAERRVVAGPRGLVRCDQWAGRNFGSFRHRALSHDGTVGHVGD